jgi:hypothetical protein
VAFLKATPKYIKVAATAKKNTTENPMQIVSHVLRLDRRVFATASDMATALLATKTTVGASRGTNSTARCVLRALCGTALHSGRFRNHVLTSAHVSPASDQPKQPGLITPTCSHPHMTEQFS